MTIELPELAYAYEALEPFISGATLRIHHGKHHRAYVDTVNSLIRHTELAGRTLEAIVKRSALRADRDPVMRKLFNSAAQAWNHAFYWNSLHPSPTRGPRGALAAGIERTFGDARRFAQELKWAATAQFGSGWIWLILQGETLKIATTSNADTPVIRGQVPLFVIDLWEHAYYLDYQERRTAYVADVVDHLLNWEFAERNFERSGGLGDEVIVCGEVINTSEIEGALMSHPTVAEAAVVGYPHPTKGQGIYAYVALKPEARSGNRLRREIGQWMSKEIGPVAVPDIIQWTPALPRTGVGMLERGILRKIAANEVSELGDTSRLADPAVVAELIRNRANKTTTARAIGVKT